MNFTFDALKASGIFGPNDIIGGDGFWPEDFVDLLVKKQRDKDLAYMKTGTFSPAQFVVKEEVS